MSSRSLSAHTVVKTLKTQRQSSNEQRAAAFYLGALPPVLKNKHSYKLPEKQKRWLTSNLLGSNRPFFLLNISQI